MTRLRIPPPTEGDTALIYCHEKQETKGLLSEIVGGVTVAGRIKK